MLKRWLSFILVAAMSADLMANPHRRAAVGDNDDRRSYFPWGGYQDRKATFGNAILEGLGSDLDAGSEMPLHEAVGLAVLSQAIKPLGNQIQEQSRGVFDKFFVMLGIVLRRLGIGATFTTREMDELSSGALSLLSGLKTTQHALENASSQSRVMSIRDKTREDDGDGHTSAAEMVPNMDNAQALLTARVRTLVNLTDEYLARLKGRESLVRSNLDLVKGALVSIQKVILQTHSVNELVGSGAMGEIELSIDCIKSACEMIKMHVDPSYDPRASVAGTGYGKTFGGMGRPTF